ncbi:MAG: radical SAM protein [Chloroflexi bacterium]|jgi:predicted DNA-binding helix-hairpin-helix protein|nr:radical SAM protein [Chloroflexota bacterium]MBT3669898.1 radical SAM protein [Chloroflexota bacterium]MBT4534699.1 radical SAM protein [Chloroflexota bacterium]MBT4683782.1 radical SAM protein [Chloroflexota bacterium]MBT4755623.1 radical SAM protein [Chloroflexota bacterium]
MNSQPILADLTQNMNLETDSEIDCQVTSNGHFADGIPISKAVMPNGKSISLLKTMITSACEKNCYYCPFRAGRDFRRATFTPDKLAHTFMRIYYAKAVEGVFLSSGVLNGGVSSQDKLIDTAEILRSKYEYRGYLHLKLMPGVEKDQVERAMMLASRISINLEAPNECRLKLLAPKKNFSEELIQPLKWAEQIRRNKSPHKNWNGLWPSSTTQFVVGAVGETDMEIISTSEKLFSQLNLKRVYYSKFNPIEDTPLENHPAENPWRQHRLYQSSYLLRDYGFSLEEMPFDPEGNLPLETDPKIAWAKGNLTEDPIEINKAEKEELIRIPGIGHKGVQSILQNRKHHKVKSIQQLKRMGIGTKNARDFILLDGKRPARQTSFL